MSDTPEEAAPVPAPGDPSRPSLAEVRLRGLVEISRALGSARHFDDVVRLSAAAARAALDAASVSVARWEPERGLLRTLVNVGDPPHGPAPGEEVYPVADYAALLEIFSQTRGRAYTVDAAAAVPGGGERLLPRAGRYWALLVPIVLEGRVWGGLHATRPIDAPAFAADDLAYGSAVAAHIAAGIAQAGHLEQANRLAYADPLTGLANRRAFDERLDQAMDRHRRDGRTVSVVLCDVNRLKQVNDQRGHEAGDRLLEEMGHLLATAGAALPDALCARVGGDEFCLLAEGPPADAVVAVAERIAARAAGLPGGFGVSIGVASTADPVGHVDTPKRLLRLADAAQYRAKRSLSATPVVAGRRLPPAAASALPPVPEIEPGVPERRRAFPRSTADRGAVLAAALRALDEAAADLAGRPQTVQTRLEIVADAVGRQLDASGWWVSHVRPGERVLQAVSWSVFRVAGTPAGSSGQPGRAADQPAPDAQVYDLDRYPWTAEAVRGGGYELLAGAPRNDPAEDAVLVAGGYNGAAAGGVTTPEGGWLVEVFTDEISARVSGLGPVLRALVCVAAHPAPA